eukprot:gene10429-1891_t
MSSSCACWCSSFALPLPLPLPCPTVSGTAPQIDVKSWKSLQQHLEDYTGTFRRKTRRPDPGHGTSCLEGAAIFTKKQDWQVLRVHQLITDDVAVEALVHYEQQQNPWKAMITYVACPACSVGARIPANARDKTAEGQDAYPLMNGAVVVAHTICSRGNPSARVVVGTTHVTCAWLRYDCQAFETAHGANWLRSIAAEQGIPMAMLVGDFNFKPGDGQYNFATTGEHDVGLWDKTPLGRKYTVDCLGVRMASPLVSAMPLLNGQEPETTNKTDNFSGCLDYMFFLGKIFALDPPVGLLVTPHAYTQKTTTCLPLSNVLSINLQLPDAVNVCGLPVTQTFQVIISHCM